MRLLLVLTVLMFVVALISGILGLVLSAVPEPTVSGDEDREPREVLAETLDAPEDGLSDRGRAPSPFREPVLPTPAIRARLHGRVTGLPKTLVKFARLVVAYAGRESRVALGGDGAYDLPALPSGRRLSIGLAFDRGPCELDLGPSLRLTGGENREQDYEVTGVGYILGVATDGSGRPVAGVRLALVPPDVDWTAPGTRVRAVTTREGRFILAQRFGPRATEWKLVSEAVSHGYLVEERLVTLSPDSVQQHHVRLAMGKKLSGVLVGPDHEPLAGARVEIEEKLLPDPTHKILPVIGMKTTDSRGWFEDDAFRPGAYRLVIRGMYNGQRFLVVEEDVPAGREDMTIRFAGFGTLALRFEHGQTGAPLEAGLVVIQRIFAQDEPEPRIVDWTRFYRKSKYEVRALPAGTYRVCVRHPGFRTLTSDAFEVKPNALTGPYAYRLTPR